MDTRDCYVYACVAGVGEKGEGEVVCVCVHYFLESRAILFRFHYGVYLNLLENGFCLVLYLCSALFVQLVVLFNSDCPCLRSLPRTLIIVSSQ